MVMQSIAPGGAIDGFLPVGLSSSSVPLAVPLAVPLSAPDKGTV